MPGSTTSYLLAKEMANALIHLQTHFRVSEAVSRVVHFSLSRVRLRLLTL